LTGPLKRPLRRGWYGDVDRCDDPSTASRAVRLRGTGAT